MTIAGKKVFALGVVLLLSAVNVIASTAANAVVEAARKRTLIHEIYDGSYRIIAYPNGDVPNDRGVCTDVIIRAYRALGIDLQKLVHEDMKQNFKKFPPLWGLSRPDSNIDHRRVPNLQRYFERHNASISVRVDSSDYRAGDLVTWMLPGNLPHIGIVSDRTASGTTRRLVIHNIGAGTVEDDSLLSYPITGHYRYFPQSTNN